MSDASQIRRGLRTMRQGLEQFLSEHRAGVPLSTKHATALREKFAQYEQERDWIRKNTPALFAKVRSDYEVVDRLIAELRAELGEAEG